MCFQVVYARMGGGEGKAQSNVGKDCEGRGGAPTAAIGAQRALSELSGRRDMAGARCGMGGTRWSVAYGALSIWGRRAAISITDGAFMRAASRAFLAAVE